MKQRPVLKLPIARLGKWFHSKYGTVEFTQETFDALQENFEKNVRGYEPYLRYGHNKRGPGVYGGEPALGHLVKMYQLGDVLWGDFKPTRDDVVEEIRNGEYRYASAEIIFNAKDKATGQRLKAFLKGHSLTNEPFVPNLPRNAVDDTQYLSEEGSETKFSWLQLSEFLPSMDTCTNCGAECEDTNDMDLCPDCAGLLSERAKPELTTLQALVAVVKGLFNRVDNLPNEIAYRVNDAVSAQFSEEKPEVEVPAEAEVPVEEAPQEEVSEDIAPQEETAPDQEQVEGETAPEETPADEAQDEQPEEAEVPSPDNAQEIEMTPEELENLKAELAAAKAEAERLLTEKAQAEAAAEEALKELEIRVEAEKAAADEAARLDAERKEQEFAQALTDRVEKAVSAGVPPVMAERAKTIVANLVSATEEKSIQLSEGEEPVDLADAIFSLLSEAAGAVDFSQYGMQPSESNTTDNPWAERIARLKTKDQ